MAGAVAWIRDTEQVCPFRERSGYERYVAQPPAVGAGAQDRRCGRRYGPFTMLRGLKKYTKNLTAIVTVADDGGGSGMLRRDIGMPPPGDIRHCMEALANTEPIMEKLLTYRFTEAPSPDSPLAT